MNEVYNIETIEQYKTIMEPMRGKIIRVFGGKEMTAKQAADVLGETPAKVYYHVRELEKIGMLKQIRTETKGNLIEKYYKRTSRSIIISPKLNQAVQELPPEEARDIRDIRDASFLRYIAYMHDEGVNFINSAKPEDYKKGMMLLQFNLSRDEMKEFSTELTKLLKKYRNKEKGKKSHKLFILTLPVLEKKSG